MALDELRDNDLKHEIDGFTYLINSDFMQRVESIRVDFQDIGFRLTCGVEIGGGSSGCSGCGTTSNCCSTH